METDIVPTHSPHPASDGDASPGKRKESPTPARSSKKQVTFIDGFRLIEGEEADRIFSRNHQPASSSTSIADIPESLSSPQNSALPNQAYLYEDNDIQHILLARIQQLQAETGEVNADDVSILACVDNIIGNQLESRLRENKNTVTSTPARKILIPCNLGTNHWIGIYLSFDADDERPAQAFYMDSLGREAIISKNFQDCVNAVYPGTELIPFSVYMQDDDNITDCGVCTVENLLLAAELNPNFENGTLSDLREKHLAALRQYDPAYFSAFSQRQQLNIPTVAPLTVQQSYLRRFQSNHFSLEESARIGAIMEVLNREGNEVLKADVCTLLRNKDRYRDAIGEHLNALRRYFTSAFAEITMQQEHLQLSELISLFFKNPWIGDEIEPNLSEFIIGYEELCTIGVISTIEIMGADNVSDTGVIGSEPGSDDDEISRIHTRGIVTPPPYSPVFFPPSSPPRIVRRRVNRSLLPEFVDSRQSAEENLAHEVAIRLATLPGAILSDNDLPEDTADPLDLGLLRPRSSKRT